MAKGRQGNKKVHGVNAATCDLAGSTRPCSYDAPGDDQAYLAERRERHTSMFQTLSRNDIRHWAHNFLSALEREPSTSGLL